MTQHISEILHFVRIESTTDGSEIWWPALCSTSFDTLMKHLSNPKIQGLCVLRRRKLIRSNESAHMTWVVLFGKHRPEQLFYGINNEEVKSQMKGLYVELETMESTYGDNDDWCQAKEEALTLLEKSMSSDHYTIDCPDGLFTVFNPQMPADVKPNQTEISPQDFEMQEGSDIGSNDVDDEGDIVSDPVHSAADAKQEMNQDSSSEKNEEGRENKRKRSQSTPTDQDDKPTTRKRTKASRSAQGRSTDKSTSTQGENNEIQASKDKRGTENPRNSPRKISSDDTVEIRKSQRGEVAKSIKQSKVTKVKESNKMTTRGSARHGREVTSTPTTAEEETGNYCATTENKSNGGVSIRSSPRLRKSLNPAINTESSLKKVTPQKNDPSKQRTCSSAERFRKKNKRIIKSRDPWTSVMNILNIDYGFYHVRGSGLVNDYFVYNIYQPDGSKVNEVYMKNNLEKNKTYFIGEDGLKAFANKKFKWIGEVGRQFSPMMDRRRSSMDVGSRLKLKRKSHSNSEDGKDLKDVKETKSKEKETVKEAKSNKKTVKEAESKKKKGTKERSNRVEKANPIEEVDGDNVEEQDGEMENLTVKERLVKSTQSLNECNNSKTTFYDGSGLNSTFSQNKVKIDDFLENATSLNGNGLLYVCGNPGQGKTTLVKDCVDLIASKNKKITALEITASTLGEDKVAKSLTTQIAKAIGKTSNTSIETIEKSLQKNSRCHLVMILDEIQFLMKSKTMDPTLVKILEWASSEMHELTIIGISNSVGDNDARLLHSKAKVANELVFKPYAEEDLRGIVLKRLGSNKQLFETRAIELACKKVAKNDGDARSLLDVLKRAIVKCQQSLSEEHLVSIEVNSPVLKMAHVAASFQKDINKQIAEIIKKLPSRAKIVLCVATALDQVCQRTKSISLSQLKSYSFKAVQHGLMDHMSSQSFQGVVETLECAGLIKFDDDYGAYGEDDIDQKWICLGAQLDEIEFVINESLLEHQFYKGIVDEVKQMQPSF